MKKLLHWIALSWLATTAQAAFTPYERPPDLEVKWPDYSYRRLPWRGFVETRSGKDFLGGLGVNYKVRSGDEEALQKLADSGIRRIRIEIPWGSLSWDETNFANETRLRNILKLCRENGIRPLVLLNAHHGSPCPRRTEQIQVIEPAQIGARRIHLAPTLATGEGFAGLDSADGRRAAAIPILRTDNAGWCELGAPLDKNYAEREMLKISILRYAPLCAVTDLRFVQTRDGWVRYALQVCALVKSCGIEVFDVEVWNELTFGSDFLAIENYLSEEARSKQPDSLHPGGRCWELANATVRATAEHFPGTKCIWGFSNTTFFHLPPEQLPAGIAGQSYHPYGFTAQYPDDDYGRTHGNRNVDDEVPSFRLCLPEGRAATFLQTESLMRLLVPDARKRTLSGVVEFEHYMTEHGVSPKEWGLAGDEAWLAKTKSLLRSTCFWLNKGITGFYYYCAEADAPGGFGLWANDSSEAGQLPLHALHNVTAAFAGSVDIKHPTQLKFAIDVPTHRTVLFKQTTASPALYDDELLCLLPFEVKDGRYIIATYQMTFDITTPAKPVARRIRIDGLGVGLWRATLYDPLTGLRTTLAVNKSPDGAIELGFDAVDYPRLIELEADTLHTATNTKNKGLLTQVAQHSECSRAN